LTRPRYTDELGPVKTVPYEDLPSVSFDEKLEILKESAWDGKHGDDDEGSSGEDGKEAGQEGDKKKRKYTQRGARSLMRKPTCDEVPLHHHPTPPKLAMELVNILGGNWMLLGSAESGVVATTLAMNSIPSLSMARNAAHATYLEKQTTNSIAEAFALTDLVLKARMSKLAPDRSSDDSTSSKSAASESSKGKKKKKDSKKDKKEKEKKDDKKEKEKEEKEKAKGVDKKEKGDKKEEKGQKKEEKTPKKEKGDKKEEKEKTPKKAKP